MTTTPLSGSTRFRLEEADVVASARASVRARFLCAGKPWFQLAFIAVIVTLLVLSGVVAVLGNPSAVVRPWAPLVVCALIIVGVDRWVVPWQARRHFRTIAALSREVQFSWDADGLQLHSDRESANLPWSEITATQQTTEAVLLYRSPQIYHVIPLRALAAGEADVIVAAIAEAASGGAQRSKGRSI